MKKSILLALLMSTGLFASAQWVTIPDANFANKLNELFPECMNGNQMDISCDAVLNATTLNVSNEEISDLTGVSYFANLQVLDCSLNDIVTLPQLPYPLTELNCGENNLTELPYLPSSLIVLEYYANNITELPELPSSLIHLGCASNGIDELPELPPNLWELNCVLNDLTTLPELPGSLGVLKCWSNDLIELPELPQGLQVLLCQNNDLICLPILPMSLDDGPYNDFNISGNLFTCLPNYVPAMTGADEEWLSYPLCDLGDLDNNPYGCSSFNGISGTVFKDDNGNCDVNGSENSLINPILKLLDVDGNLIATTSTFGSSANSFYNLVANTGSYTVQLVTENTPFQVSCDDPGDMQAVTLTEDEPSALNVDFGVECLPNHDVGTQSVTTTGWVFPGQEHFLNISAGDLSSWHGLQCAAGVSGSVTVNIFGPAAFVEPAENAFVPNVSGDIQLTYEIDDFANVDFEESFGVILETDTTAQAGELVCVEVFVDPIDDDANPGNNTYTHCYEVVNSYDPNIKQVWPQNVEPGYDGYFNYTIYFQNTGTAPAFNIRVADTLDTNLDLNTFEVTAYSHECLTYVTGNVATFRFNDIMLPDSTSDFDGSIGYVQYRIKPVADLPVGTVIENTAHIFFDFNEAIVTNTTQNLFEITTSVNEPQQQLATVFPNPGTGQFNVVFSGVETGITTHLEVYNLSDQRVLQQQMNENRIVLDLTGYPSGMYLLRVRNKNGSEALRVVKH